MTMRRYYRHAARAIPLLWLLSGSATFPASQGALDLEVKAGFVMNFVRLTNWTAIPGEESAARLPICASSESGFYNAVKRAAAGKTVGDRVIAVSVDPVPDPRRCRVLIVDESQYRTARPALAAMRSFPVLTVGNGAGFLDMGGMFEITQEKGKVQFDAGTDAIRRANLDVSTRLLRLAHSLRGAGNAF